MPCWVTSIAVVVATWFSLDILVKPVYQQFYQNGFEDGVKAGIEAGYESGYLRGRNQLAHELIMACIPESKDSRCTLKYEAIEGKPATLTIGEERLYCLQGEDDEPC